MIDRQRKFIFIHIPKAGGSSVESLLLGSEEVGDHNRLDRDILSRKDLACFFPLMRHAALSEYEHLLRSDGEDPSEYRAFTLVRDPRRMLCSAYRFRLSNFALRKEVLSLRKRIQFRLEHATFSVFLAAQMLRSWLSRGHLKTLHDYINCEAFPDVKVFRLEDVTKNPGQLFDFLRIPEQKALPHKNATGSTATTSSALLNSAARAVFPEIWRLYHPQESQGLHESQDPQESQGLSART